MLYQSVPSGPNAAASVMNKEGVRGVAVPDSVFVQNPDFGSPTFWKQTVDRLTQTPKSGGLHGNEISGVVVQPGSQRLSTTDDNTVQASDRLSFQGAVKNSGDSQETQVRVSLTIKQTPVLRKEQVIDVINPGETKTVVFSDLGPPNFGTRVTVSVSVEPVRARRTPATTRPTTRSSSRSDSPCPPPSLPG